MGEAVRELLGSELSLSAEGHTYRLASAGALQGVAAEALSDAFAQLTAPCEIVLTPSIETPPKVGEVQRCRDAVCAKYKGAANVKIEHFIGGPCEEDELMCCIVLGGSGCGWTVLKDLRAALELAHSRSVKRFENQGDIVGGQAVRLKGLQACPELNGEVGLTLRFADAAGRWLVRLRNGEGKQLKPQNLEALDGSGGRVIAIW